MIWVFLFFYWTKIVRKSCISSSVALGNFTSEKMYNIPTLSAFKCQLKKKQHSSQVPLFYVRGETPVSSLLDWEIIVVTYDIIYINHLLPSPVCSYQEGSEDVEHYFFKCRKYFNIRVTFFQETRNFHPHYIHAMEI